MGSGRRWCFPTESSRTTCPRRIPSTSICCGECSPSRLTARSADRTCYLEAFRGLITTWEDFAVFGFLIDRVGRYQLEEFAGCTYAPLSRLLEHPSRVMEEEAGHIDFGTTRTAEMAARGGEARERVQRAVVFWYLTGLDMFGRSESRRGERYRYWGLKRRTNAEARQQYMAEVDPLIAAMGLRVPDPLAGRKYL